MTTFQQENENSADNAALLPKLYHCTHCGEFIGKTMKLYCSFCTYVKDRKEQCEENLKINPNWKCKMCGVGYEEPKENDKS